jgi:Excalibur calcium-binding domain
VARQRGGCGCLLGLLLLGALFGGPQINTAKQRVHEILAALPTVSAKPTGKSAPRTTAAPRPTRTSTPRASVPARAPKVGVPDVIEEVYYRNCAAVRASGKAPIRRGSPGYRTGLDRDRDGIACDVT